jgi:hypothetical protein
VFNKSNYQSEPCLLSLIHVIILTNQHQLSNGSTEEEMWESINAYRIMVGKCDEKILYGHLGTGRIVGHFTTLAVLTSSRGGTNE